MPLRNRQPQVFNCVQCKRDWASQSHQTPLYCSATCNARARLEFKYAKLVELQEKPEDIGLRVMKKFLLEQHGHRCVMCGMAEWLEKPIPLVMDHIDGHSDNWLLVNLRLIFCNCDATTDTYKARNRGNGRHFRRQRYAAGLSY